LLDIIIKILILGDGAVGKTTLFQRIKTGKFEENTNMTIGVDFHIIDVKKDGNNVRMQVWDLAGQPQFKNVLPAYRKGTQTAIVMYDLTRYSSVKNMEEWIKFAREENPSLPILLVGSKMDLKQQRTVKAADVEPFITKYAFGHVRCSSKTGEGISEMLDLLAANTLKKFQ
jgi:small GTP-binding protein